MWYCQISSDSLGNNFLTVAGSNQGTALDWFDIVVKVRIHFHCGSGSHISWLSHGLGEGGKLCMGGGQEIELMKKYNKIFLNGDFFELLLDPFKS